MPVEPPGQFMKAIHGTLKHAAILKAWEAANQHVALTIAMVSGLLMQLPGISLVTWCLTSFLVLTFLCIPTSVRHWLY